MGFRRTSRTPISRIFSWVNRPVFPVARMTGKLARNEPTWAANSIPDMIGIVRSVTTTSKSAGAARTAAKASTGEVKAVTR